MECSMKGTKKVTREELAESIARHMMIETRGFKIGEFPVEWDTSVEDSQISLLIDDVEEILDYLETNYGLQLGDQESKTFTTHAGGSGGVSGGSSFTYTYSWPPSSLPAEEKYGVQSNVRISIGTGKNPSLADLTEFIQLAKNLGVDEDLRMSGSVNTSIVVPDAKFFRTERDEEGRIHYCIEDHSCKS